MEERERIIVDLDASGLGHILPNQVMTLALAPYIGCFKVGLGLLTTKGAPQVVEFVQSFGGQVFLDGDFNNTPNQVAAASRTVAGLNVKMFSIHVSAGIEAMKAAVANRGFSLVLAITILPSLVDDMPNLIFGGNKREEPFLRFANYAAVAGCDGIICSPQELELANNQKELDKLLKIVYDVRPGWIAANDQKRTITPAEAIKAGATALIIDYHDFTTTPPAEIGTPVDAAKKIAEEISSTLKEMKQ